MLVTEAHEHTSSRTGLPTGKLLAILHTGGENIHRTSPYMQVMEPFLFPSSFGPEIIGTDARGIARNVVVKVACILHCHWPQRGVCSFRPANCSMKHHGAGNGHDGLDGTFSFSILVVGSNSSKL